MKTILCMLALVLYSLPLRAQFTSGGLQDGGHGSGGDEKAEYTLTVHPGWNIVSVPITVGDYLKTSLFPTASSTAYAYQGGYVPRDTLDNGPGYWLKFGGSQAIPLSGSLIYTDSIPVSPGWNIIGSISGPLSASSVAANGTSILSSFFRFDNGYLVATTIDPGSGYWVKMSSAGTLVLSSGSTPARPRESMEEHLKTLNSITITDASGGHQVLYFVSGTDREQGRFELPPVPPAGVFDARFASQSMVALENTNIVLSSATYPVEVQWNIVEPGDYALVVDGKDSPLNSAGSTRIAHPSSQIALKIGAATELPKEFALSQNYPNPFNPTTKIRFALPVASRVVAEMYSILGQKVATLINEDREAGYYVVEWNGRGDNGQTLGSGVFLLRLTAHGSEGQEFSETRKLMLLK